MAGVVLQAQIKILDTNNNEKRNQRERKETKHQINQTAM